MNITINACGGCGATKSSERCMGCMHEFGDEASAWVRPTPSPISDQAAGEPIAIELPERVIDQLFREAGVSTYHPDGDQREKLYVFAANVVAETLARIPSTAPTTGSAPVERVLVEQRDFLEGNLDALNATRDATPVVDARPVAIQRYSVFETQDGRGSHLVEEPCNTGKWVKYADIATRAAEASVPWVSAPEALPTKPGNYLAMMADENSFGYTSDEPVLVEFDAYTDHPGQFTISDSWTNGPETATDEVEFWMPLPARPMKERT